MREKENSLVALRCKEKDKRRKLNATMFGMNNMVKSITRSLKQQVKQAEADVNQLGKENEMMNKKLICIKRQAEQWKEAITDRDACIAKLRSDLENTKDQISEIIDHAHDQDINQHNYVLKLKRQITEIEMDYDDDIKKLSVSVFLSIVFFRVQ